MEGCVLALLMLGMHAVVCSATSGSLKYTPQNHCNKFNNQYAVGQIFTNPNDPCSECRCCKTGVVKCKTRTCSPDLDLQCGKKRLVDVEGDECCVECDNACQIEHNATDTTCNKLTNCPGELFFEPDACCGQCGCPTPRGELLPPTGTAFISSAKYAECERCTCNNGVFSCENEAPCPAERLKCADGKVDNATCEWTCPYGPGSTCFHGDKILNTAENGVERIGDKLCFCYFFNDVYLYDAVCANADHAGKIEEMLYEDRCVKRPLDSSLWTFPQP